MYARMNPLRPVPFTNNGLSFAKALGWTDVCTSGTGPANVAVGFDDGTWTPINKYYAVSLAASTEYTFSGTGPYSKPKFDLYNTAGTKVAYNTGQWLEEEPWYDMPALVYTPSTTAVYILMVSNGSEMGEGAETYAVSISPRPSTYTREGSTPYGTSTGFDALGRIIRTRSAGEAIAASSPTGLTEGGSDPAWVVDASAESSYENRASQAFSGNTALTWACSGFTGWIRWRSVNGKALVRRYSVRPGFYDGYTAANWTLEGSDDGDTWTVLQTVAGGFGPTKPTTGDPVTFTVAGNYRRYAYHRLNISDTYEHSDYTTLGQIQAWSK